MIAVLRAVVALYLAVGIMQLLRHGDWLGGIRGVLDATDEAGRPRSGPGFWLSLVVSFLMGIVLDVTLWPYNEWLNRNEKP